jgi:hypothetical protein
MCVGVRRRYGSGPRLALDGMLFEIDAVAALPAANLRAKNI